VCRNFHLPFQNKKNNRRGGGKAFVPTGKWERKRGFNDAGTNNAANNPSLRSDELFTERLRVSVNVWPAPKRGALDPELREACSDPYFPFTRDCQSERVR